MPIFLAIHTLPKPVTVEEAASLGRQIYSHTTADVRWVKSWFNWMRRETSLGYSVCGRPQVPNR